MALIGKVGPEGASRVLALVRGGNGRCIEPLPSATYDQRGPNCGFYALAFVLRFWRAKLGTLATPEALPARKGDLTGALTSLRELAKGDGTLGSDSLTYIGEIFSARAMAEVATRAGFRSEVLSETTTSYLPTIYRLLDRGIPPIVGVDVDADATHSSGGKMPLNNANYACPGQFGGENAHWVTLVGYYDSPLGGRHLIQMNWSKYYSFPATNLRDSSAQLLRFAAQTWVKPPSGGRTTARGKHWIKATAPQRTDTEDARLFPQRGYARKQPDLLQPDRTITDFPDVNLDLADQIVKVTVPHAPDWAPWQPDDAVAACPGCGRAFTLFLRRHHCRQCGKVYCDDCTKGRATVRNPSDEKGRKQPSAGLVRVCKFCAIDPRI